MFGLNSHYYELKFEIAKCFNGIGSVYLVKYIPTKENVIVKKYRMDKAKDECQLICSEILMMRQFHHPNILSYYTAFVCNFEVYLVAPFMNYGSCRNAMSNYFVTGFPEILVCLILRDVLFAIEYLHRKGYIHRAIRASHILLNQNKAVLTGFRELTTFVSHGERAKTLHSLAPLSVKSLNWLAPEVLEQNLLGYTEKSDIYSIGITTCELANGIEPFADTQTTFMLTEKIRGNQPTLLDNSTCPTEEMIAEVGDTSGFSDTFASQTRKIYSHRKFSDPFHKFAETCMERYAHHRPSALQLFNHIFFKQCKHTTLYEQLIAFGVDTIDYTKFQDDITSLSKDLKEMSLNNSKNFEWDF